MAGLPRGREKRGRFLYRGCCTAPRLPSAVAAPVKLSAKPETPSRFPRTRRLRAEGLFSAPNPGRAGPGRVGALAGC